MKRMRALPVLITLVVVAVFSGLVASPSHAVVRSTDLPTVGTVAKYFPGYKYVKRTVARADYLRVPNSTCRGTKLHRTTSLIGADYTPTFKSDWGTSPLKPIVAVYAAETSTTASASAMVASFRNYAKRCKSYTENGGTIRTSSLSLGTVGEDRVGFRQAETYSDGSVHYTFSVVRKGRKVTLVVTASEKLVSGTRVAGLTRAAYKLN